MNHRLLKLVSRLRGGFSSTCESMLETFFMALKRVQPYAHTHKLQTQLWFVHQPRRLPLFSSPGSFHAIPLMLSLHLLSTGRKTPSLRVISLSTPHMKGCSVPKSTHTHTHSDVDWGVSTSCSLTTPSHRPSVLSPPEPLALFPITLQRPLQPLHPAPSVHDLPICPSLFIPFLSLPGSFSLPSQEPCPINNSLSSLNVLSFLG